MAKKPKQASILNFPGQPKGRCYRVAGSISFKDKDFVFCMLQLNFAGERQELYAAFRKDLVKGFDLKSGLIIQATLDNRERILIDDNDYQDLEAVIVTSCEVSKQNPFLPAAIGHSNQLNRPRTL